MNGESAPKNPIIISVKIKQNDDVYTIRFISENNTLVVNVSEDETTPMINYTFKYSLSDLEKINRYFRGFDSFEELMPELKDLCEEKENKIKIQKNRGNIILTLILPKKKDNEAHLTIPQAKMDDHQVIIDLCSTVNELKKQIKLLGINQIPEEQLEKNLQSKDIILNEEEKKMLCDWILKRIKKKLMKLNMNNQGKNIQVHMALLYKATQHGDSASKFHKYCDNKGATLTLIRNTKGFRFGGFTTQSWSNSNNYKKDPYAFLFSLDYKEYYPSYDGKNAIYDDSRCGPRFGDDDIEIRDNFLENESKSICFSKILLCNKI